MEFHQDFTIFVSVFLRQDKRPGGGIGRRTGLKILGFVKNVRVQVPPRAQSSASHFLFLKENPDIKLLLNEVAFFWLMIPAGTPQ